MNPIRVFALLLVSLFIGQGQRLNCATASEPDPQQLSSADLKFFEASVRPLLIKHCLECHGDDVTDIRGGLNLSSKELILLGGDSGPPIDDTDISNSLLLRAIRYEDMEMPPSGKLSSADIEIFTEWVRRGLPDPRQTLSKPMSRRTIDLDAGRQFWSFRQPQFETTPRPNNRAWSRTWIDDFVAKEYESQGLIPNPDANRTTLVRRIFFAITGLPPTVEEIDRFVSDPRHDDFAIADIVDRLLASPRFGERWGRHWLDVARFAESSGGGRSLMFRNAWRYRDYTIDMYNQDKPFKQSITEQIAGDLLPWQTPEQRANQLVATGLLVLGPTNYEQQDKESLRLDVIDEQIDTVGRAFLGMSLGCARCHDHKFDPIPTTDYYALAGIFSSTQTLTPGNVSGFVMETLPPNEKEAAAEQRYQKQITELEQQRKSLSDSLKAMGRGDLLGNAKKKSVGGSVALKSLSGIVVDDAQATLVGSWTESTSVASYVDQGYRHDSGSEKSLKRAIYSAEISNGGIYEVRVSYSASANRAKRVPYVVEHAAGQSTVYVNQRVPPSIDSLFHSLGEFSFEAGSQARVVLETKDTSDVVIADAVQWIRPNDNTTSNGEKIVPIETPVKHAPAQALLANLKQVELEIGKLRKNSPDQFRFAMTVKDVAQPHDDHVRIRGEARNLGVIVPRGFISVASPPNAEPPKLDENQSGRYQLAQWIASDKNPLTARVYVNRLWQHIFGRGLVETPDNHGSTGAMPSHPELLDRLALDFIQHDWSTKRLLRTMLTSRVFRLTTSQRSPSAAIDRENTYLWRANRRPLDAEVLRDAMLVVCGNLDLQMGGNTIDKFSQYDWTYDFTGFQRRSIYVPQFRNAMLELLEIFDSANPNMVTGRRPPSTLPTQSLYLMNHPFMIEQSRTLASRLPDSLKATPTLGVTQLYRWTLGREPTDDELAIAIAYIDGFEADDAERCADGWSSFCHILLACVDFRYSQ